MFLYVPHTSLQDNFDCAPLVLLPFIYKFQITLYESEPMNNACNYFVKKLPKLFLVAKNTFGKNIRIKRVSSQVERTWLKWLRKETSKLHNSLNQCSKIYINMGVEIE